MIVLPALILIALVVLVAALVRRPSRRVRVRTCCSARPWPPTDLVDRDG